MPLAESLAAGGAILAATVVTFIAVSYSEVKAKIDNQIAAGEDPYELQVERTKPKRKAKGKASQRK